MRIKDFIQNGLLLTALASIYLTFLCCTGSGKASQQLAKGKEQESRQGLVSASLLYEPTEAYPSVQLHVTQVELIGKDGKERFILTKPNRTLQLKGAPDGKGLLLCRAVRLPGNQDYRQVRVTLAPERNRVVLADGRVEKLELPDVLQRGIPVPLQAGPHGGRDYDLALVLDVARSIQRSEDRDGRNHYSLRPALWATDRSSTGSVSGRLVDTKGDPVPGITVTAQKRCAHAGAEATVVRRARTGSDGKYRLDLLTWPEPSYAVVNLLGPAPGFAAQASPALDFSQQPAKDLEHNATLVPAERVQVSGSIRSAVPAHDHDEVDILQELPTGGGKGGPQLFVVQGTLAVPAHDRASSTFSLTLAPGDYMVRHTRVALDGEGRPNRITHPLKPWTVRRESPADLEL